MKPRPLLRSITFWSGVLVMGFVVWAWWDSGKSRSTFVWDRGRIVHMEGYLGLAISPSEIARPLDFQRDTIRESAYPAFHLARAAFAGSGSFSAAHMKSLPAGLTGSQKLTLWVHVNAEPPGWFVIYTPHWLILLAVSLPWSLLLFWRSRRVKKAQSAAP